MNLGSTYLKELAKVVEWSETASETDEKWLGKVRLLYYAQ